jgi:tRNA-splicing endonuclease subunit Sen54
LLPEEALYLVERGSLDVRWPVVDKQEDDGQIFDLRSGREREVDGENNVEEEEEEPSVGELPMSLPGAYASFIGKAGLTVERYLVYARLKRSGYIVQRAPTWDDDKDAQINGSTHPTDLPAEAARVVSTVQSLSISAPSLIYRLVHWFINPHRGISNSCLGPLVASGPYRIYNDIFRALSLILYHTTLTTFPPTSPPKPPLTISYLLYKPTPHNRKSAPPSPNYRVCVVDARSSNVPTISQIGTLLDSMPEDGLQDQGKRVEAKMKHGRRNVLVAVVDMGVTRYLRFAEAEIERYKLFEETMKRGGKGKRRQPKESGGRGPAQWRKAS